MTSAHPHEHQLYDAVEACELSERDAQNRLFVEADKIYQKPGEAVFEIFKTAMVETPKNTMSQLKQDPEIFGKTRDPSVNGHALATSFKEYEQAALTTMQAQDELDAYLNPEKHYASLGAQNEQDEEQGR